VRIGYVFPMGDDTRPGVPASPPPMRSAAARRIPAEILDLADAVEAAGFDEILFWMDPPTPPGLATLASAMA
jgi:hypothetical protein